MNGQTKNTVVRTLLLLFIAGMLALIAAKLHLGDEAVKAITNSLSAEKPTDSAESKTKSNDGSTSSDGLSPLSQKPNENHVSKVKSEDIVRVLSDGSSVSRMQDGYGNSTVTRDFKGHKLIRMILVRYSANGERRGFVYAKNGKVNEIPKQYFDRLLSASADEIASAAQIYDSANEGTKRKERLALIRDRQRTEAQERFDSEVKSRPSLAESRVSEPSRQGQQDPASLDNDDNIDD